MSVTTNHSSLIAYKMCIAAVSFIPLSVIALTTVCRISEKRKFYVKYYLYCLYVTLISVVILFLCLFTPRNVDNIRYFIFPLTVYRRLLGIEIEMRDEHYLSTNRPCLIVANHQNLIEILGADIGKNVRNVTLLIRRENLSEYGFFGWATWLCGCIFIDRYNHKNAMKTMEECASTIKNRKIKLFVFPEGTYTTHPDTFLPFKKGAFNLAVKAQIPIMPVVVLSFQHVYSEKKRIFETGRIIMTCLPPVSTVGLTLEDVSDLTENVRQKMLKVFKRTTEEVSAH